MPTPDARRALLSGLIDYAGLFPPAALDLDAAAARYAEDRAGGDAWMLGRFVLPAARLDDFAAMLARFDGGGAVRLSLIGLPPAPAEPWADAVARTLAAARAAERTHPGALDIDRFECPLPEALAADPDTLAAALHGLREAPGFTPADVMALEVPFLADPGATAPAAEAVAQANRAAGRDAFALKFRCGGVTPDAVPTVEALALALTEARRAGVPFKATAGLHHPFRHQAADLGAPMHGFVNVFGGAALAARHDLGADDLAELLDDGDPSRWQLDRDLAWARLQADGAAVRYARASLALSFGSCSFDDPRADLRAEGWL